MSDTTTGPETRLPPAQTVSTGFVVAIVGFFGTFPIVLAGLDGVGATSAEASSGLMAAAVTMGLTAIALSVTRRQPISVAWPTAGVALLVTAGVPDDGFAAAVGAFLVVGALTIIAGLWKPLGELAASIPVPLAQAMLGGVLLSLCLVPFQAVVQTPGDAIPVVVTWFIVSRLKRLYAVSAAVVVAAAMVLIRADFDIPIPNGALTSPVFTAPTFSFSAIVGIALPLFIVAMATQNVPGIAILKSYGYTPPPSLLLKSVGAASMTGAMLGSPGNCMAAITAAMCAGDDSYLDPTRRYWSAICAGVFYCLFGIFAGLITAIAALAPRLVLGTLAGVALISVFTNSVQSALDDPDYREAAVFTFLVTASGVEVLGFTSPVLGLLAGGIVQLAKRFAR